MGVGLQRAFNSPILCAGSPFAHAAVITTDLCARGIVVSLLNEAAKGASHSTTESGGSGMRFGQGWAGAENGNGGEEAKRLLDQLTWLMGQRSPRFRMDDSMPVTKRPNKGFQKEAQKNKKQ